MDEYVTFPFISTCLSHIALVLFVDLSSHRGGSNDSGNDSVPWIHSVVTKDTHKCNAQSWFLD
jgi:hypothetical protein